MTNHDGGPAFPRPYSQQDNSEQMWAQDGMSLRDFFAAHALAGMLASGKPPLINGQEMRHDAAAYLLADAMLKEREKKP